jgi:hypothetical protein
MKITARKKLSKRCVIFIDLLGFSHACDQQTWETSDGYEKAMFHYKLLVNMSFASDSIVKKERTWEAKFLLSDCVFLTTDDPNRALYAASTIFHSI